MAASHPDPTLPTDRTDARDLITVFFVSGAIMLYQLTLTRVLSVVVWYHFAFLTISLVMLGLGVPGVWFALSRRPLRYLPGLLLVSGVTIPASVVMLVQYGSAMLSTSAFFLVACVLPATLSLGAVVCLILVKAEGPRIARVYGIDLLGAALAAALVIPLMDLVPTPQLAAASGLLPLACAALQGGRTAAAAAVLFACVGVVILQGAGLQITRSKAYDEASMQPIYERWSPTARITVFDERFFMLADSPQAFLWGRGSRFPDGVGARHYWLEQDGNAGTPITEFDGDLTALDHLLYDVTTVGYQLRPPKTVAIIGAGGGRDILSALVSGATRIDAIEINTRTIEAVSSVFGAFSGDPYHAPGVRAIASEGRSHLTHSQESFDLIQISLIDSWAASVAGAFALAENNLYTIEAFQLYARRLSSTGLVSTTRWTMETPRLIVLARAALRSLGIANPDPHLVIVSAAGVTTLLTSLAPFTKQEVARLDRICKKRGFERVHPRRPGVGRDRYIVAALTDQLGRAERRGLNTAAPTDDSPYFFQVVSPFAVQKEVVGIRGLTGLATNVVAVRVLREAMLAVFALALLLFLAPFAARLARLGGISAGEPIGHLARGSLYFAAIGAGFMLVENVLVQRFVLYLGHPSYATTVIIATLLVGLGVGSMNSTRIGLDRLQRFGVGAPLLLLALVAALPSLFAATLGWPLWARIVSSTVILLPVGLGLGFFFPLGMQRFGDAAKPWYWAINGVFGVVASVLSLALSMELGFTAVGIGGAAVYAVALVCLAGSPRGETTGAEALR